MSQPRRVKLDKRGNALPDQAEGPRVESPGCTCPYLDRDDWDRVENDWTDITFVKSATNALLGVPIGFAGAKSDLEKRAKELSLQVPTDPMLLLGAGKFRRTIMLEVEGATDDASGVYRPGGMAYSRLVSAPWGDMRRLVDETRDEAREKFGRNPDGLYVWYLTCRVCSRERNFETLILAHFKQRK